MLICDTDFSLSLSLFISLSLVFFSLMRLLCGSLCDLFSQRCQTWVSQQNILTVSSSLRSSHLSERAYETSFRKRWGHLKRTLAGLAPFISWFSHSPRAWLKQEVVVRVVFSESLVSLGCWWLKHPLHFLGWLFRLLLWFIYLIF